MGRVEEALRETRSRVGGEMGEDIWTARGMKQGCPLSPLLFSVMIADLEEVMGRLRWRGVRLDERVYTLAYADDMVLLAENKDKMRSMIDRFKRYLERKKSELNAEKLKIMRLKEG